MLWCAALDGLAASAPDDVWGAFPYWLGRTVSAPERAEKALRRLFQRLDRPSQQAGYLLNLHNALFELKPLVPLLRGQQRLIIELARGWLSQSPAVEPYGCSHNVVMAWAQLFLPLVPEKEELADACFQALALHCLPPLQGCLQALCPGLAPHLTSASAPTASLLLERGLGELAGRDLKPYTRKRNRVDPGNVPGLQLGFHGLAAVEAHPEWQLALPDYRLLQELSP